MRNRSPETFSHKHYAWPWFTAVLHVNQSLYTSILEPGASLVSKEVSESTLCKQETDTLWVSIESGSGTKNALSGSFYMIYNYDF